MEMRDFCQKTFRVLLNCMARPGTVGKLDSLSHLVSHWPFPSLSLLLYTLMDRWVSFSVVGDENYERFLRELTGAKPTSLDRADFVVFLGSTRGLLSEVKVGSYESPEEGAFCVYYMSRFESRSRVLLQGPGIEGSLVLSTPLEREELLTLSKVNSLFPLGVDLILLEEGKLFCLPRSTRLEVL
ncbi:MAG: phosphonate C-P lyase system protein PhnH [Acidobacteria bacterium]|jgi:alpha-D-ribose 1-methylphosphonate 5-triphosphate synthase subunit PhnH|nr:MAG: phosphonate C-P lyase system protein PhnH [Acidobacteriota bacterium]